MKINFAAPILDTKGKPIPVEGGDGAVTTLGHIAEQALLAQHADEQAMPVADKVRRYKLFNKISGGDDNLDAAEVILLKACIGRGFAPLAVGRAFDVIESAESAT